MSATSVEIVLNWEPQFFNVWPLRSFTKNVLEAGRFVINLSSLSPNESFCIELMSINRELPALCNVRSDQGESRNLAMDLQPVYSKATSIFVVWLMAAGAVFSLWLSISGIQFISRLGDTHVSAIKHITPEQQNAGIEQRKTKPRLLK